MNKNIVKIFALTLAVVLLAVPVFAGGDQPNLPDDAIVHPRGADTCTECGGEMVFYRSIEGDWEIVDYTSCQYGYNDHTDVVEEKVTTIKYRCNSCKIIDTEYFTETRQYCR